MSAWYRAGTVEATNGSSTVTGTSTAFLMNAKVGDLWAPDADGRGYEITAVNDNTEIEIFPAYAGSTGSGKAYGISRISTNWNSVSEIAVSLADILASQQNILSGSGVPSDDFGQDGDVYFRQDEAEYYTKASGEWSLVTSLVGPQGPGGPSYQATSSSSLEIGTGSKTFELAETGRGYAANQRLRAANSASNYMEGVVSSYSGTTLVLNVTRVGGSGTFSSWNINITGDVGPANSLAVGSVTTGNAGTNAAVEITGSAPSQTINFTIPRGNTGIQGNTGPAGTITVGTVTALATGDPATVTNIGTSTAAILDFGLPRGATGASYSGTSSTSNTIGTGSKTFTVPAGMAFVVSASRARFASAAGGGNFMEGLVTAYSGTSMTILVDTIGGSGTRTDWNISLAGQPGTGNGSVSSATGGIEVVSAGTTVQLVDTAVTPGEYAIPVLTVDQKGRITAIAPATIEDPVAMAIVFGA